jgi:hypothetical protein
MPTPDPARVDAEQVLYDRWGGLLYWVFQRAADPKTGTFPPTNKPVLPTGSTQVYSDPLNYALRQLGKPPGNPVIVGDGDVNLAVGQWDMMLDLAEYRLISNLLGSFTDVTESNFGRSASYDQLASRAQKRLDALTTQYASILSPFRFGASSGVIRNMPPTAQVPRWAPGYNGRNRGGYYGGGGFGGFGGW